MAQPERAVSTLRDAWIVAATSGVILAKLLVMAKDRPSAYQGDLGLIKRVAWTAPLPLEEVKAAGKALGATINDVLVAVVAGALRRYLLARGDDVTQGDIRAMVPVNLRAADAELVLGNMFSLVYLGLPVGEAEPQARLAAVKRQMDVLKHSPEPALVYEILTVLGMVPGDLAHWATDWFATKASVVLTNVPGPREPLYFAGQRLRQMIFWVPQSGGIGMGISIFSYAGEVVLALQVDNNLVPDPEVISAGFEQEFAELREVARATTQRQDAMMETGEPAVAVALKD
jgi:WS/DGAT/MGAT family acyltransferase